METGRGREIEVGTGDEEVEVETEINTGETEIDTLLIETVTQDIGMEAATRQQMERGYQCIFYFVSWSVIISYEIIYYSRYEHSVSHQLSETPCIVTFDTPCITFYGSDARGFQPISCWNGRWVWKLGRKDAATRYLVIPRNIRTSHR
ncbi:uncharacterized protein LOC108253191 isoform X2 [Diaphorina citri]|uniref:Uncharacterized protein LOC108253191 isoform X2 n=1 Tax=Diaphorina citri TaxID=121845 RepID=A0A3Q0J6C6_DIACI|nr:uncharacterized protein LOC108253191 isoform X2 [Diaphorina citri]